MTLVKTMCTHCLGVGVTARMTTPSQTDPTGPDEVIEVKCPTCNGAGYRMLPGEIKNA